MHAAAADSRDHSMQRGAAAQALAPAPVPVPPTACVAAAAAVECALGRYAGSDWGQTALALLRSHPSVDSMPPSFTVGLCEVFHKARDDAKSGRISVVCITPTVHTFLSRLLSRTVRASVSYCRWLVRSRLRTTRRPFWTMTRNSCAPCRDIVSMSG